MGPITGVAVYLTLWWTILFAVLPWGVTTHAEAGIDKGDGGDPAAPVNPNLGRKFLTTTWISAIAWVLVWAVIHFGLIKLPPLPSGY